MSKQLVIVESPAKAKTIEKFLGKDFSVLSSYGHIRDLPKKEIGIDIDNYFEPKYVIPAEKKKNVQQLKKALKEAETVWLATDEDREGEAIAWHLMQALGLDENKTKRIAFHEITKEAVTKAIKNPRPINNNLIDAQQARRVLDRLVGYELSPLLWKKVQPGLSAGRVQSVAVRLIVEKEREIEAFQERSVFKVSAIFKTPSNEELPAELTKSLEDKAAAEALLKKAGQTKFKVAEVVQKPATRNPSAPFTTSTLQQTASRKLNFSVRQTMTLAQRLYEAGHITYMRTDSVILSDNALNQASNVIKKQYGAENYEKRTFKNKRGAQEAHEAIRPTSLSRESVSQDSGEQRLYELIRGRTLASQMKAAQLNKTTIIIGAPDIDEQFEAKGEVIVHPGWLKVYQDTQITDTILPKVTQDEELHAETIEARQSYKRAPARYSEAALVKQLESMGIGRPSTYAPTISTIQDRGYVEKGDVTGEERTVDIIKLDADKKITESQETVMYGQDKNKLMPTQIALLVNDFLTKNFADIVDYDFTKEAEEEFDRIAHGKEQWNSMIADFYKPFHNKVTSAESLSREEASGARELGVDPKTNKPIIARMGRYGPMLQRGHAKDSQEKPDFAPIPKGKKINDVTLEEALELFELPRQVGTDEDGSKIEANFGRFGPYVKANGLFAPIPDGDDPFTVTEETAKKALAEKKERNAKMVINDFGDVKVLNGRFGPYITDGKKNAKIPKELKPEDIKEDEAKTILKNYKPTRGGRRKTKKNA